MPVTQPPAQLVWHPHSVLSQMSAEMHPGFQARPTETTEYLIHDYRVAWLVTFTDHEKRDCNFPSFEIHSEADAKATCERHYTTGQWK